LKNLLAVIAVEGNAAPALANAPERGWSSGRRHPRKTKGLRYGGVDPGFNIGSDTTGRQRQDRGATELLGMAISG